MSYLTWRTGPGGRGNRTGDVWGGYESVPAGGCAHAPTSGNEERAGAPGEPRVRASRNPTLKELFALRALHKEARAAILTPAPFGFLYADRIFLAIAQGDEPAGLEPLGD